ncbi:putative hypothetical protein [Streptomyces sp. NBRC 110611]|uniref:putative phosphothreonine lyase domain-containing protein n=1 Tax=Streptomyces sp. NBRC 110611 TaxID=1621259 RepID=UPI00082E2351|nr:putative phosphothreonine lyase domain-containg protein [Streptomyces sp. NBRC 110611]GAU71327.1 putative hypothetical protein [Streptomyces sp. NBRC 110611]
MHTRATQTGHTHTPAHAEPSAVTDSPWLWATTPHSRDTDADAAAYGKWLWFLPVRALDAGWQLVKAAVEAGHLGPGTKVATLGNGSRGDPTRRPVIIYTVNHHDEDDVLRVLVALRALGINDALAYKTDEATKRGEYGDLTSIYTSPAGTTKLIRRDGKGRPAAQPHPKGSAHRQRIHSTKRSRSQRTTPTDAARPTDSIMEAESARAPAHTSDT